MYVPYPWELYDIPLSIPSTSQILDVVGVESYVYVLYSTNAYTLKALIYDYDGNQISASPFTHTLGIGNTFNMASIQFYIDVSTINIIGDCYKTGKNKIFADQLTPSGFSFKTILPLTGNQQGVVYNLKSELEGSSIYVDAKNVVTGDRVLYKIDKATYAVLFTQTMTYTGEYYIGTSGTGGITDFYVFSINGAGTVLNVDRYDETPSGFITLTATSAVNCYLPQYNVNNFFPAPSKVDKVIDQGIPLVIIDEITHTATSIGPMELVIDLTGFPLRLQNGDAGIENNNATLSIYPNPSSAEITIELKDASKVKSIEIFNMTGGLVATYNDVNDKIILQRDLPEGIYFLHLTRDEGEVITKKFVKTN
ncbi:MAG: T9SS type A sorting domain-containing protein [Chitinophagaceae bacterium]|nr:T9SS type A sorting domain-containing protein [Chitinophagaceae bacterium]